MATFVHVCRCDDQVKAKIDEREIRDEKNFWSEILY